MLPVNTRQEVLREELCIQLSAVAKIASSQLAFILQLFLLGSIGFGLVDQVDDDKCRYWCLHLSWKVELASTILENHYQASDHIHHELTKGSLARLCAITQVKPFDPLL